MANYNVTVDENTKFEISNEEMDNLDVVEQSENNWHIISDNQSYKVEILSFDKASKTTVVKVNGVKHEVGVSDPYDQLVKQMGLSATVAHKVDEIKAPMPGLVLDIMVEAGQEIKECDPLLILEAMKMENVLKSPGDGVVEEIKVEKGKPVDKGTVLIKLQ
ncbi:MAG: biotin/lipoyl-containing protein [Saprospiraceae bacterium]